MTTGLTHTGAVTNVDRDSPEEVDKKQFIRNILLVYPIGLTSAWSLDAEALSRPSPESGASMLITAFQYKRGIQGNGVKDIGTKLFSVYVPMPGNMAQSYGANWAQFEGGIPAAAAATSGGGIGGDAVLKAVGASAATSILGQLSKKAESFKGMIETITDMTKDQAMRNTVSAITGYSINPRQEMAFNGMKLRTHSFQFNFNPVSPEENRVCVEIIKNMRYAQHSRFADAFRTVMEYPAEFVIEFFLPNGSPVPNIPSIPDCYLTNFSVTYNPGLSTARFHSDGNPLSYQIQLQFAEGIALSRDDLINIDKRNEVGGAGLTT